MSEPDYKEVARRLFNAADKAGWVRASRFSPVWPPYENESGFLITLHDGSEVEVLVREREAS